MITAITWVIIISAGIALFRWDENRFNERESEKTRQSLKEGGWSDEAIDCFFEHAEGQSWQKKKDISGSKYGKISSQIRISKY